MSIALDSVASGEALTWAHTCTGSNRLLTVAAACQNSADNLASATVTYAGVSMGSPAVVSLQSGSWMYTWVLVNPATGTNNIVIANAAGAVCTVESSSFTGVNQTTPISATATYDHGYATSPRSMSISVPVGGASVDFIHGKSPGVDLTKDASQTVTNTVFANSYGSMSGSYKVDATAMVWTWTGGAFQLGHTVIALAPAASGATATTLSGPSSGTTGVASTNFTVGANGTITGTVTVTPNDAANGGTFTPTTVAISSGTPTATFTYTPASTGAKTINISDNGSLTDAANLTYTSNAAADTAVPTLTGVVTSSTITQTTYTLSWPTGADNVAVTAYEYNINGGAFVGTGTATTVNITGRTAGSTDTVTVRAKDAAGNVSTPVLSTTVNLLAAVVPAITTPVLKNNTGTVLASETGVVVNVYNASTGALVLQKTGLTSNGSGIVTFTDATLSAATSYAYEVVLSGGRRRLPLVTTT